MAVRDKERFDAGKWRPVAFPLFIQNDASFFVGIRRCIRLARETSFDFLFLSLSLSSLYLSTLKPFHPIGSQDPGWSWQIRQQNERDVSGEMSCADAIRELHYCASGIKHADKHI